MKPADPENKKLLELFKDLRVADIRDGMDWLQMHPYGSMDYDIRPVFRVRACGIARTGRSATCRTAAPYRS